MIPKFILPLTCHSTLRWPYWTFTLDPPAPATSLSTSSCPVIPYLEDNSSIIQTTVCVKSNTDTSHDSSLLFSFSKFIPLFHPFQLQLPQKFPLNQPIHPVARPLPQYRTSSSLFGSLPWTAFLFPNPGERSLYTEGETIPVNLQKTSRRPTPEATTEKQF